MAYTYRQAICNEAFEGWDFAEAARCVRMAGYTGIEIAPFTLAEDPWTVPLSRRKELREIMAGEGLTFVGLHWLMVSPKGLHVTTPDDVLRAKSWLHIRNLIDLCGDLGPDGMMVFGSPLQRGTTGGSTPQAATRRFVDGVASVAKHAQDRGVTLLIEALPVEQCNVVTSLDEAAQYVDEIGSPAVQTMFDVHNAINEKEPHEVLVERHFSKIRHVHVNELDGGYCGTKDYDFKPLLATLARLNYKGWVSLESFDFKPGAETIATGSLRYLEAQINELVRNG